MYSDSYADKEAFEHARKSVTDFEEKEGRRPRILLVKLGQDGHDRGVKVVATGLADLKLMLMWDLYFKPLQKQQSKLLKMTYTWLGFRRKQQDIRP